MNDLFVIALPHGKFSIIDALDAERFGRVMWCGNGVGYVVRRAPGQNWKLLLHRKILGAAPGEQCDHIHGDKLDNRRCNLRVVTKAENARAFRTKKVGATSRFRGVCWDSGTSKWTANTELDGKKGYLGLFTSEEDAARAYDAAAVKLGFFREALNFPNE